MGDFNTFPDDGASTVQMRVLEGSGAHRRIRTQRYRTLDGTSVSGTWVGYPEDRWSRDISALAPLDHIWLDARLGAFVGADGRIGARDALLVAKDAPSDHLALTAALDLFWAPHVSADSP